MNVNHSQRHAAIAYNWIIEHEIESLLDVIDMAV